MKRLLMLGVIGMIFTISAAAQTFPPQEGNATWYATPGNIRLQAEHATLPFGTRIRVTNLNNNNKTIVTISGRIPDEPGRIVNISQEAAKNLEMGVAGSITPVLIEVLSRGPDDPADDPSPPPSGNPSAGVATGPAPPPSTAPASTPAQGDTRPLIIINIYGSPVDVLPGPGNGVSIGPVNTPSPAPAQTPPSPSPRFPAAVVLPRMPDPGSGNVYRVQVGSFLIPLHAQNTFEKLRAAGFSPFYEQYENYKRVVLSGVRSSDMQRTAQLLGNAGIREVWIRQEN